LFWVFFAFTPLQYVLVARNEYNLYSVLIPVYGFLFIPARIALAGDFKRYLERCAKIQAGLMICVYCLSHAPALLHMRFKEPHYDNRKLLFYFVLVVVASDAFGYICEKLLGRNVIAPAINANRTWEGFLGGLACATMFGMAMSWATPFSMSASAMMSAVISVMGFAGGLTMSAIKRDRGVKDYGTLVQGHGGVLDRIDSICFAAPVFFHLTRYLFTTA
jgi:phosphatidate cytidylyltransferase